MLKTQIYGLHVEGFAKHDAVWNTITSLLERGALLRFVWITGQHLLSMVSGWRCSLNMLSKRYLMF